MKKKLIVLFTAILAVSMIGCNGAANSDSGESGAATTNKYEIGDIILNDGTCLRRVTSVSETNKEKAIAIIFKVDGSKAYGVGLVHNKLGLAWCLDNAKGYNKNFTDLQCNISGDTGDLSFTGDTDGSDNFTKITPALGTDDDTGTDGNYPAFEFAENYKKQQNSHVSGTAYEDKWYLPTMSELFDIWKVKSTVDATSRLCGGTKFSDDFYWSSSQYKEPDFVACGLNFSDGGWGNGSKNWTDPYVCCIRVFD